QVPTAARPTQPLARLRSRSKRRPRRSKSRVGWHPRRSCNRLSLSQHPIDRRAANVQPLRDFSGAQPLGLELLYLCQINRRLAAPVDARCLRFGDALELTFTTQVGLELGEDAQHVEEALACGGTCVDRLFHRLEDRALRFERPDNILQIANRARQAI